MCGKTIRQAAQKLWIRIEVRGKEFKRPGMPFVTDAVLCPRDALLGLKRVNGLVQSDGAADVGPRRGCAVSLRELDISSSSKAKIKALRDRFHRVGIKLYGIGDRVLGLFQMPLREVVPFRREDDLDRIEGAGRLYAADDDIKGEFFIQRRDINRKMAPISIRFV